MTALPPDQLKAIQAVLAQQQPAQAEQIAQSIAVTVQRAPINIESIARALLIDGTATQTPTLDQLLVRTGQGDFLIRTPEALRQQLNDALPSRVTLQLRPGPNGLEAVLVVGSRAAVQANQVEQSLASNSALSRQTLTTEIPKIGQVFQVTVLPSTLLSNLLPGQQRTTSQKFYTNPQQQNIQTAVTDEKTSVTQTPISTSSPSTTKLQDGAAPDVNETSYSQRNVYDQGSTSTQADGQAKKNPLPINHQSDKPQAIPLRIVNVGERETVPINDKIFTATVRGTTPSGQPVIAIDDRLAVVNTTKSWPVGTKIGVTLGAGAELVTDKEIKPLPTAFENLRQALELIAEHNPAIVNNVKHFRIAQAQTGQVSGALLFFMAALQKGNITAWLGNDIKDALETLGKQDLLQRVREEFLGSKQPAQDTTGLTWHGTTIPYLDGDKLQQFRFYVHDDRKKEPQAERDIARRFLIDISLSRLGPVQIDGLVHQKKLDLIVRTGNHLPENTRNDLRVHFQSALEQIRYTGNLIFQANKQGWVDIKTKQGTGLMRDL